MSRQTVCSVASTITVGLDLGDRFSRYSELDFETGVIAEGRLHTTPEALRRQFVGREPLRAVMEVGTHSTWVSRPRRSGVLRLIGKPGVVPRSYLGPLGKRLADLKGIGQLSPKWCLDVTAADETQNRYSWLAPKATRLTYRTYSAVRRTESVAIGIPSALDRALLNGVRQRMRQQLDY